MLTADQLSHGAVYEQSLPGGGRRLVRYLGVEAGSHRFLVLTGPHAGREFHDLHVGPGHTTVGGPLTVRAVARWRRRNGC